MACASLPEAGARAGAQGRLPGIGGLRFGCPTRRGPRPARLSGPGVPWRNAAAASLGAAEATPVDASPKKRPPYSGSRVSGSPASASYMEDPRGQKKKKKKNKYLRLSD